MGFSIRENFKAIRWGPTLLLHLMRAFSAGLVWCLVMLFVGGGGPNTPSPFSMFVMFPILYFTFVPMILIICKIMSAFIAVLGEAFYAMVSFFLALGIIVGDPLLLALNKFKPGILPLRKFNFVNFSMILFVLDPAKV
jgi:hypothetical protein